MKTTISIFTLLLCFCFTQNTLAQHQITVKHSCSFDGEELNQDFYTFDASSEADKIVAEIVAAVGLQKNFIVKSSDCKNALATTHDGKRYILYNTTFLEKFKQDARTKWAAYCVMAHELGHHLNHHDFQVTDNRRRKSMELEADIFAGSVMYALGASLEEAKAGIDLLQQNGESNTHPPARARAEAIASGWKKKEELQRRRQPEEVIPKRQAEREEETQPKKRPERKPEIEPEEERPPVAPLTTVSDQLIENKLVGPSNFAGFWTTSFYNNNGQLITNNVGLFNEENIMIAEMYINGLLSSTSYEIWTIKNKQFIETDINGFYFKYDLRFTDDNTISLTFKETNGVASVPLNTVFTYVRYQP